MKNQKTVGPRKQTKNLFGYANEANSGKNKQNN